MIKSKRRLGHLAGLGLLVMTSADAALSQVYVEQIQPTTRTSSRNTAPSYAPAPNYDVGPFGGGSAATAAMAGPGGTAAGVTQRSTVQQNGVGNAAAVALAGEGNTSSQIQNGRGNSSNLSATGAQNSLSTVQNGAGNSASVAVTGNNNTIANTQIGSGASYTLQHVGNGQSISVTQVR